jgi:O-antigen ligase
MPPSAEPLRDAAHAAPTVTGVGLALAALLAPPLAALAPVGIAPLVALLAVASLASGWRESVAAAGPYAGLFVLLALISAWSAITALWSPVPGHSLVESGRFLLLSAGGVVVLGRAAAIGDGEADRLTYALVAGLALAVLLLQIELRSNGVIARYVFHIPTEHFASIGVARFDRGITVLLLMTWPATAGMAARRHWFGAALLMLAVVVTVIEFDSRASILAIFVAFGALAVATRLPRVVAMGMIGAVVLIAFVFPLVAPDGAAIERVRASLPRLPPSAVHRLVIWRFVAERIGDRPLLGWGMDTSRALPGGKSLVNDLYPEVRLNNRAEVLPLHPHDAALQWRLELGVPGTLLALAALTLVLWRLAREPRRGWRRPLAFGYAASALIVALLSFGIWQAWWLSTLWLGAALQARLGAGPEGPAHHRDRRQPRQAHV